MVKAEIEIGELYKLITQESVREARTVILDREKTIKSLKSSLGDIKGKYDEAIKLWEQSNKIYQNFIKENMGSRQIQQPAPKPVIPMGIYIVKGYVDMFTSIDGEKIKLETSFVKNMFLDSIRGISDARKIRDDMVVCVSGMSVSLNDSTSSKWG